jgi:hypothetical protein
MLLEILVLTTAIASEANAKTFRHTQNNSLHLSTPISSTPLLERSDIVLALSTEHNNVLVAPNGLTAQFTNHGLVPNTARSSCLHEAPKTVGHRQRSGESESYMQQRSHYWMWGMT